MNRRVLILLGFLALLALGLIARPRFFPRYVQEGAWVRDRWSGEACRVAGGGWAVCDSDRTLYENLIQGRWTLSPRQPEEHALEDLERDLRRLANLQEIHYAETSEYSSHFNQIGVFWETFGSRVSVVSANELGWAAWAFHMELSVRGGCAIWYDREGATQPAFRTPGGREVTSAGLVVCDW